MWDLERRQRRVERARAIARAEIGIALAWVALTLFMFAAMPGFMGPRSLLEDLLPPMAIAAQVFAVALMIWIYRANPEPEQEPTWRYRDF
jgi:hypothetical protein